MEEKKQKHVFRDMVIRDIFDLVKLNLIFVVCCMSVIGIPAGIGAMTNVNLQIQRGDKLYVVEDFLHELRKNFLSNTLCGLLLSGVMLVFGYVFWFYSTMHMESGMILVLLRCMALIPILLSYCAGCYLSVLNAMIDQPFTKRLRNAVLLSMICLKESAIFLLVGVVVCAVTYFGIPYTMPVLLVFSMAFWNYTCAYYGAAAVNRHIADSKPQDPAE